MYQYIKKEDNDPLFTFITKYGLNYYVAFKKMDFENDYFQNLYSIDFWEVDNTKFIRDSTIEVTIIEIIFEFFSMYPNVLLHYVCDSMDSKQSFRSKLFDSWYNKSINEGFSKLDINYEIPNERVSYKLEFIFKSEFYSIEEVGKKTIAQLEEFSSFK
ncbi:DUF6169 family protein [Flavobacterium sp.]|jgi:hypothetical protein|uniref:DUF6169 family protein n=1 Tax=Flavobacterium sp. TaxID=239 RepID=UPI0037C0321F